MLKDFRYGVRMLRNHPGFSLFAVLALAIGIGANTTVFSVVNQALLKPPAYREPGRIVFIQSMNAKQETLEGYTSYDDYQDLRHSATLQEIGAVSPRWNFNLRGNGGAEQVSGQWASASLFHLLGVNPILGRTFTPAEDREDSVQAVVLSYQLWQRVYGGSPSILGTRIRIDNSIAPVVGVMPAGFRFLDDAELWIPLAPNPINPRGRAVRYLRLAGRLAPGANVEQARSEISGLYSQLAARYPNSNSGFSSRVMGLGDYLTTGARPILLMLAGAVGLVLLIACANVANLVLTRTLARRQELAVRVALGASRIRLVRQLASESLVLAAIGGGAGLLLAEWGMSAIRLFPWKNLPQLAAVEMDPAVVGFAMLATLVASCAIGVLPALPLAGAGWEIGLKGESRSATVSAGGQRTRSALMICEIALTTMLLAGSGLLLRSLVRLLGVNPGFDAASVLTFQVNLPSDKYGDARAAIGFYERFSEEIRTLRGVRAAGAVSRLPLGEGNITSALTIEGRAVPEGDLPSIDYRAASDSYFAAMGIPLVEGRLADPLKPYEVNINQTAARRFWPGENAIGKHVKFGPGAAQRPWQTVVGIVGDVHHLGLDIAPRPEVYRTYTGNPLGAPIFAVRATGDKDTLAAAIRERLRAIDPEVPMFNVFTMEQLIAASLESRRFAVGLLAAFGGIALLLAGIGLYGVVSYAVGLRTHEIGIRVALGAQRAAVVRMVLAQGLRIVLAGLAIGLAAALALGPVFARLVYGIGVRDPISLLAGSVVLLLVAAMACYLPARRAAELDPMEALR